MGRGVMIDAEDGIIAWRHTSSVHATSAISAGEIVELAARLLGLRAKGLGGTRWKRPEDPVNTGLEPDKSFYVGRNAELWLAAWRESRAAALAFEAATPPDLVVEVEATHFAAGRPRRYAALGVPEMWLADRGGEDRIEVEILDLQAPGGPRTSAESLALPGLKAASLPEALDLAERLRYDELEELLAAALEAG